jgi:hypothetical protein
MVLAVNLTNTAIGRGYPCQILLNLRDVATEFGFASVQALTGLSLLLAFRTRPNATTNLLVIGTDNDALIITQNGVQFSLTPEQTALLPTGGVYLDLVKVDGEVLTPIPVSFSIGVYDPPANSTLTDYISVHELHPSQLDFSTPANSGLTFMGWI